MKRLDHLPVGFGSHHWLAVGGRGGPLFITVDELRSPRFPPGPEAALAHLDRAFRSAAALAAAGLEFVVAPIPAADGSLVCPLGRDFSLAVFPVVDGEAGPFDSQERQVAIRRSIRRLHDSTEVVHGVAGRDSLEIDARAELESALGQLNEPWPGGPYAERTLAALGSLNQLLREALAAYDRVAAAVRTDPQPWVVTHGEPKPGNVIWSGGHTPHLIDWDTVLIAPAARDLWWLEPVDDPATLLYALGWDLKDLALFVADLLSARAENDDLDAMLGYLEGSTDFAGRFERLTAAVEHL